MALIDYIDCEKATIAVLRDFYDQCWIVENSKKNLTINSKENPFVPFSNSSVSEQERKEQGEIQNAPPTCRQVQEAGYQNAICYQKEFMPCWNYLSEEERDLLKLRYMDYLERNGINRIIQKYAVSKSEAYRRSEKALKRLVRLLFW